MPTQSAARSKVRKLRYIAELESKSAALQDEATRLHEELQKLQEDTVVLSEPLSPLASCQGQKFKFSPVDAPDGLVLTRGKRSGGDIN